MWNDTATGCQWAMQTCWQFSELAVTDCSFQFVFSSQFPSCSVVGCLRSSLSVAAGQAGLHSAAGWPSVSAGPPGSRAGGRWCWTRWESSPPPTRSGRAQPGPCWSERGSAAGRRPVTERESQCWVGNWLSVQTWGAWILTWLPAARALASSLAVLGLPIWLMVTLGAPCLCWVTTWRSEVRGWSLLEVWAVLPGWSVVLWPPSHWLAPPGQAECYRWAWLRGSAVPAVRNIFYCNKMSGS